MVAHGSPQHLPGQGRLTQAFRHPRGSMAPRSHLSQIRMSLKLLLEKSYPCVAGAGGAPLRAQPGVFLSLPHCDVAPSTPLTCLCFLPLGREPPHATPQRANGSSSPPAYLDPIREPKLLPAPPRRLSGSLQPHASPEGTITRLRVSYSQLVLKQPERKDRS